MSSIRTLEAVPAAPLGRRWQQWRRLLAAPAAATVVAACGGGGDDLEAPVVLRPAVQAVIGPAGGSVTVPITSGVTVELDFPANALREGVSMTFTPEPPEAGSQLRLRIEPGDVELAQPLTLRLTGAAAPRSTGAAPYVGSLDDRMFLPTTVDAATGALTARTLLLQLEAPSDTPSSALRTRRLSSHDGGPAGFINIAQMDCLNLLPELDAQILRARQSEFTAHRVYQLLQTIKLVEPLCESDATAAEAAELQRLIEEIKQAACDALLRTVDAIALFAGRTDTDFYDRANRLLGAQAAADLVGAGCNPTMPMEQAYAKAMNDYIEAYAARVREPQFGGPGWLSLRGELKRVVRLYEDAFRLEMVGHQQALVDTVLRPALARLHAYAFETCRRDSPAEQGQLADLWKGGTIYGNPIPFLMRDPYGQSLIPQGIENDIQHCASSMQVRAFDGAEELPNETLALGGGGTPGSHVTQGTIEVPLAEGVLSLQGIVRPLLCASPNAAAAYDESTLVIKFDGVVVRELAPVDADFMRAGPVELLVRDLYTAAGLDATQAGSYTLEVVREGTGCNGTYGVASVKLFEVTVTSINEALQILLLSGAIDAERDCDARAEEFYETGNTPPAVVEVDSVGEPANCRAVSGSAQATSSASASSSGPTLDDAVEAPRPITSLSATGSAASAALALVPTGGPPSTGWAATASADAGADGRWELRVQGQAVTMTITGSVANGFFSAEWRPSAGGPGEHGSYRVAGDEDQGAFGPISLSVRLEPGQTVRISAQTHNASVNSDASVEWDPDGTQPGGRRSEQGNASYAFSVTFAP